MSMQTNAVIQVISGNYLIFTEVDILPNAIKFSKPSDPHDSVGQ